MRLSQRIIPLVFAAIALHSGALFALDAPKLNRYVTDQAGVLSAGDRDQIESLLQSYDESTGNQFVVLIVTSLEGESLEEYSLRVAEKNGIGREGQDNGLLFLVAVNDRKMRFEVGYGLEPVLTDALTSVIIRDIVAPEFRSGNFAQGVYSGMQATIKAASGEFVAPQRAPQARREKKKSNIVGLIIFIIVMFFILKSRRGRGGGIWFIGGPFGGGGFGGGGGGFGGGGFGGFSGGGGGFGGGGSSGSW